MYTVPITTNPFALLIDPQAIFDQIARSERLERLQRRVCHPLDKPLLPLEGDAESSSQEADAAELAFDATDEIEAVESVDVAVSDGPGDTTFA